MAPTGSPPSPRSQGDNFRVVRRRNRVPLSCAPCRSRKLKCNRSTPCENCVKRGEASACTYAAPKNRAGPEKGARRQSNAETDEESPVDMQNRIDRLESLVLSLMNNGDHTFDRVAASSTTTHSGGTHSSGSGGGSSSASLGDGSTPSHGHHIDADLEADEDEGSDTEQVTKSLGVLKFDQGKNKAFYISDAHWTSILKDLQEVRSYFQAHANEYAEQVEKLNKSKPNDHDSSNREYELDFFGWGANMTESEVRAAFPSTFFADRLINDFFLSNDKTTPILHRPTFEKQYAKHQQDPSKTDIAWLAMVYAIFRRVLLYYYESGNEPLELQGKCRAKAETFRKLLSQCLVLANYHTPRPWVIETLILVFYTDYSLDLSDDYRWTLTGMATRLAMRMGYHRDGDTLGICPFQSEMRRRIWAFVRGADTWQSYKVALPAMVRSTVVDTKLPRHLLDEDFDENTVKFPPERPLTEVSPLTYTIAKGRFMNAFAWILEHMQVIKGSTYEEVLRIDEALREAYQASPECFRAGIPTMTASSTTVSPNMLLKNLYLKGQMMLHRRFLRHARENQRYLYSRKVCIESALEMLHSFFTADSDARFENHHASCSNATDSLFAAIVIAMDLSLSLRPSLRAPAVEDIFSDRKDEMLTALRRMYGILYREKDQSIDMWKGTIVLKLMWEKLGQPSLTENTTPPTIDTTATTSDHDNHSLHAAFTYSPTHGAVWDNADQLPSMMARNGKEESVPMTNGLWGNNGPSPLSAMSLSNIGSVVSTPFPPGEGEMDVGAMSNLEVQSPEIFNGFASMPNMNFEWPIQDAWDNYLQTATLDPNVLIWDPLTPADPMGETMDDLSGTGIYGKIRQ